MKLPRQLEKVFKKGVKWAQRQETQILQKGVPLTEDQKIDAYLIGLNDIEKVRLLMVDKIPIPKERDLKEAMKISGMLSPNTIGITFRYGIYIRKDYWNQRRLLIHELTHTKQYERSGGFELFLREYLLECINLGYPNGPLEKEAKKMEDIILNRRGK